MPRSRRCPVAFLLTSFDVGGTERQMVELIRRLDTSRFEVHVACFHRGGPLEPLVASAVESIEHFPIAGFARRTTFSQAMAFRRWCVRRGIRIVQTCELYSNIFGLPAAALAGVECRVGSRRELVTPDKTRSQLACQRLAYGTAHAVVANSSAAADRLRREGVPARRIHQIRNGVDCRTFAPAPRPPGVRRVITVANLRSEKGHDTLLAAATRVLAERPDIEFALVGDGVERSRLERETANKGLSRVVRFLGERADVADLLSSSDLFVLPSRSEACPNSVLEAMAAGLPVIASRVGGIPELISHGVDGVLVEPDRPDVLAEAILDVARRPEAAQTMGCAARSRAVRDFSFDRMVANFEDLYLSQLTHSVQRDVELAAQ